VNIEETEASVLQFRENGKLNSPRSEFKSRGDGHRVGELAAGLD
jgi:hypothetical protein